MIKIKLIPNIIDNKDRKEFQVKFENKRLLEIVSDIVLDLEAKEKANVLKIIINGKKTEDLKIKPKDEDEIIIVYAISGQDDWIAGITIVGAVIGSIIFPAIAPSLYVTAGFAALSWGYNKIAGQRKPSYGSAGNEIDSSSPTYGWDGVENTQSAGLPLAIIYGENKVGGNVINLNMSDGKTTPSYTTIFFPTVEGTDYSKTDTIVENTRILTFTTLKKYVGFKFQVTSYTVYNSELGTGGFYAVAPVNVSYKKHSDTDWIQQGVYQAPQTPAGNDKGNIYVVGLDEDYYDIKVEFGIIRSSPGNPQTTQRREGTFSDFQLGEAIYESIENNQKLNMLLALGEGEVEDISNVYINDNPIENYQEAEYQIRKGTVDQSLIGTFQYLNSFFQITAKVLKDKDFYYKTYNNNITGFEINFVFPSGIWSTDNNGAYNSWTVTLKIGYKLTTEENYTEQTVSFNYKSRDTYRNTIKKIDLPTGQYDIKITKTTDDPDNQYTFGDCQIMTINEIKQKALTYPNTALLAVSIKASEQISNNIPTITSVVRGKKIMCPLITDPNNFDKVVEYDNYYYDDENSCYRSIFDNSALDINENISAFTQKYNANPIWCLFDLLTNSRYGLGDYISIDDIDIDSFLECSKYCDTLVNGNKKLRLDIVFDSIASAIDIIQQITQSFRGFVFFTTGKIKVVIDKPGTVTQMFSMGNIIAGSFSVSKKSNKDYCNSIDITYYDKKNNYKQDVVTVEDQESIDKIGMRNKSIRVFANSAEYAKLAGEYFLRQDKYINEIISFKASVDAIMCQPGDVIAVCHDNNSFNKSGRVISYENGIITVDCDLTIEEDKTYKIQIKLSDDTIVEKDVLNSESGTTREIEVEDNFTLNPQNYDIFSFYESTKEIKKYRITNMKKDENLNIEITAIEYNEKVYDIEREKPEPYEEVDYILSSGTQYIDTNITPSSDLEYFKITFNLQNPISLSGFGGVFGAEVLNVGSGGIRILSFAATNGGQGVIYGNEFNPHLQQNQKITLELKNKIYTTSEGHREEFTDFVQHSTDRKILLFAIQGSTVSYKSRMKLYEFKMGTNENNLIIDLIPVLNKQTGKYGMFDTISGQFFGNSGSGDFGGGND